MNIIINGKTQNKAKMAKGLTMENNIAKLNIAASAQEIDAIPKAALILAQKDHNIVVLNFIET